MLSLGVAYNAVFYSSKVVGEGLQVASCFGAFIPIKTSDREKMRETDIGNQREGYREREIQRESVRDSKTKGERNKETNKEKERQ